MSAMMKIAMFIFGNWKTIYRMIQEIMELFEEHPAPTAQVKEKAKRVAKSRQRYGTLGYVGSLKSQVK